jgi:signal transduction histidine kinase
LPGRSEGFGASFLRPGILSLFKVTARTVLELGSELISSDIIAFYELIKNTVDARSKTGADVSFQVVLRRNSYLRIRAKAVNAMPADAPSAERKGLGKELLPDLLNDVSESLDIAAGVELVETFRRVLGSVNSVAEFVKELDEAYQALNTIEIADTGSGMSLAELTKNYLTIGTPSRKHEVDRVLAAGGSKSPYLGEKGIGRLSVMRLGDRLRIETARSEDTYINLLEVNWKDFNDLDAMVEDIPIEPKRGPRKDVANWSGTRLKIGDLSEDWTESRVRGLAEFEFARITDPFSDPKARPRIALHWNGSRIAIPWMDRTLIEHAHAAFKGKYTIDGGRPELQVRMDAFKLGFEHPHEVDVATLTLPDLEGLITGASQAVPLSALSSVGPFEFEAYWYNRRHLGGIDTIGNQRAVRELQKKWSGILLFRDGFRVFPYGDDDDDWLGLDRRALGRPGYVLNKAQFVGRVNISRARNPGLVDQTNREGLRATPEQEVFIALLQHIVRDMLWDFFREVDRRYKKQPLDLGNVKAEISTLETRAKSALSKVRKIVPKEHVEVVDDLQHTITEFHDLSVRAQRRIEEVEADGRQMVQMAGVGLMVEVVAHELARAAESALEALEGLCGKDVPAGIRAKLETLQAEMKSVSKRLRVLDQLSVSGRQRSELFDLAELVEDTKEGHVAQFQRHHITMRVDKPKAAVRVKVVKGMVVQIIENLIANSVYWMQLRASREARYMPTISVRIEANPPAIYFTDNGPGIAPDHRERVFRPFWSLKEKSKRRGLGLFIARENATYLGGTLTLSEKTDRLTGRLHEFVFELPDSALAK